MRGPAARFPSPLRPLSAYVAEMLGPFDFARTGLRLPDRVFRGRELLSVGGREVHLIEVGPAHTPGDLIVHLPDADLVFAADVLFVGATPVMWFGPLEGWLAAIETMLSLDAEVYVPGHGQPGDRAAVEELRDYLVWVGQAARDQHRLGRSPLETTRVMLSSGDFRRWRSWECPERLLITVATVHRALEGRGPIGAAPTARARLFAQIGALRAELASRGDA